ncbi:MAG: response regulator transcription factor [Rhodospirillales bacterium]|nr:response regulator [Rhodospirillales bacterium]MDE2200354.1 response regulator transcription factor [Rhodospirillales bacterium]MDE2573731.1 response regulator transcription factor [Rhodospirillales bacterium]
MGTPAPVHVVDDDEAVRESLRFLLEQEGMAVRTYAGGAALLAAAPAAAGCVLTDFHMPGMDGLELQARLATMGIGLPVIVMTGHGDVPVAVRAMKAGAVDFLEKPFADAQLLDAVRRALAANRLACEAAAEAARAGAQIARLTPREREVLDLLVAGRSSKEIAKVLGASPRTVDVHRGRVFHKLNATTLPDLVRLVLAAGGG